MRRFHASELRASFEAAFAAHGPRDVVVVHASTRAIGDVEPLAGLDRIGTLAAALLDALGGRTLVVPAFTPDRVDPLCWPSPPPRAEWDRIRAEMPLFDPARSTPTGVGALAARLATTAGAARSSHPVESVAAIGPRAAELVRPHPIDDPNGPRSPWARVLAADAAIVLVGVGLERCTLVHHAERMVLDPHEPSYATVVPCDGERAWVDVYGGAGCSEGFPTLEPELRGETVALRVGAAMTTVTPARAVFERASARLRSDARALLCRDARCPACSAEPDDIGCGER